MRLTQFVLDPAALGLPPESPCANPACRWPVGRGSLVQSTMLGITHTPCTPRELRDHTGCPFCGEDHPQPYDGGCLL